MSNEIKYFDIAYNSIYDGKGIRVVVYFQGCNADCIWCHSPHSRLEISPLLFNEEKCINCGLCEQICENDVHKVTKISHILNRDNCNHCGKCILACPMTYDFLDIGVLCLPTKKTNVKELFDKLSSHLKLVKNTGGITLGGGEALLQSKACKELLMLSKSFGINTTVETSGLLEEKYYKDLEGLVDTFLFGMRFTTNYKENDYTNKVYKSYEILSKYDSDIIPRIPIIRGHTDTNWYLQRSLEFLQKHNIKKIYINPFNENIKHYYNLSGIEFRFESDKMSAVARGKILNFFKNNGFEIINIKEFITEKKSSR